MGVTGLFQGLDQICAMKEPIPNCRPKAVQIKMRDGFTRLIITQTYRPTTHRDGVKRVTKPQRIQHTKSIRADLDASADIL